MSDNNREYDIYEINELVKLIIVAAIEQPRLILDVNFDNKSLSQLSRANIAAVRNRFGEIIKAIAGNVRNKRVITYVDPDTKEMFREESALSLKQILGSLIRNYYKVYFSLRYKERFDTEKKPIGHPSKQALVQLHSFDPTFDKFDDDFLRAEMQKLDDFLSGAFERISFEPTWQKKRPEYPNKFKELAEVMEKLALAMVDYDTLIDSEPESVTAFNSCITAPVTRLLEFARSLLLIPENDVDRTRFSLHKGFITRASIRDDRRIVSIPRDGTTFINDGSGGFVPVNYLISDAKPDVLFNGNKRKSIMFCELKGTSFQHYKKYFSNYDHLPLEKDKNFEKLLLQYAYYLICTGTDISLMSDFDSLIVLGLNYVPHQREEEQRDQTANTNEMASKSENDYEAFRENYKRESEEAPLTHNNLRSKVVPFTSLFIDTNSTDFTVQAAFASILYRPFNLSQQQSIQQSENCSILCRDLTRVGFHLSKSYRNSLHEFGTIITSVFNPHSNMESMKDFELDVSKLEDLEINVSDESYAQQLKFKNSKLVAGRIGSSNDPNKKIIIKIYDDMSLNKLYDLNFDESDKIEESLEEFKEWIVREWNDEVSRYQTITNHRNSHPNEIIDVPEFFSHGKIVLTDGDNFIGGGLFIAMSYIEPMEYPQDLPEIDRLVLERCKHSVQLLTKLKVKLNYISRDELIYHDKKLFLINFSNQLKFSNWVRGSNFVDIKNALEEIKCESAVKVKSNDKGENRHREGEVNGEKNNSPSESVHHGNNTRKRTYNEDSSNKSSKRRRV